jgi:hypothetical protein
MNFNHLDFLIYSSHKTSTQSLVNTINKNKYNSTHFHILSNFNSPFYKKITNNTIVTNETFIQGLINYKNTNNKKLKIITVIRDPKDRLLSSFFQSFFNDEMDCLNKSVENTTISVKNEEELCILYEELVKNKKLPGRIESINEMAIIFGINVIENLEKKKHYYYLNNELFELFVLDFNKLISSDSLNYLNDILKIDCVFKFNDNLSKNKLYYNKYKNVKKILGTKLDNIIENQYESFYFTAFEDVL